MEFSLRFLKWKYSWGGINRNKLVLCGDADAWVVRDVAQIGCGLSQFTNSNSASDP